MRVIYAAATSFNAAMGLLGVKGIEGECGIEDSVHSFFYGRKINKKNNFFRFTIEENWMPNDQDDYGPNHNGTIVLSVRQANRNIFKFKKYIKSLFEKKNIVAKELLSK